MLEAVAGYQRALAGRDHLICYAMKANPSLAVLQTFAAAGCGFDIVSGGELERVLAAGGDPAKVVFSGVGKTAAEMRRALEVGVLCFNVESEAELERLSQVASEWRPYRACEPARQSRCRCRHAPLHLDRAEEQQVRRRARARAVPTYRRAAQLPGIEVVGIDCHIGSQITAVEPYLDALDKLLDLVEAVEAEGIRLHHLDLGGGLGITYADERPPAIEELVARLVARIDERGHGHRKILFEPGRSLVGNAGVLVTEVLYLKPAAEVDRRCRLPASRGKHFCIVDAAMNDLMRPAMYEAWMAHRRVPRRAPKPAQVYDVVGPGLRIGRLARPRPRARGARRRPAGGAVGRCLRHEHGEQLQQPRPRRRGDGRRQRGRAGAPARAGGRAVRRRIAASTSTDR